MTRSADREALNAVLRRDFTSFLRKVFGTLAPGQQFVPGWHIRAIVHRLEQVRRSEIRRLIINMPPRSLKSMATSVAFPAFVLGHDPTRRIICASYSADFAHRLSNDFRAVLESPWYRGLFPGTRVGPYKDSEGEIELTHRGFRLATSVGGTLTGRGGEIIIIDDPLKPLEALSESKRNGVNRDEWTVLSLPAIADAAELIPLPDGTYHHRQPGDVLSPVREPLETLEQLRLQLGSDLFAAQYQQTPVPPGGAMIKRHWLRRYVQPPNARERLSLTQSWDTAAKGGPDNDWSVCTTWHFGRDRQCYLLDVWTIPASRPKSRNWRRVGNPIVCLSKRLVPPSG